MGDKRASAEERTNTRHQMTPFALRVRILSRPWAAHGDLQDVLAQLLVGEDAFLKKFRYSPDVLLTSVQQQTGRVRAVNCKRVHNIATAPRRFDSSVEGLARRFIGS